MKKISMNLLTNLLLLFAGALLLVFYNLPDVMLWVSRVLGCVFMLPSLVFLLMIAFRKNEERRASDFTGILPVVGGLCFGVLMVIRPAMFSDVLATLMGALLLVLGLFHFVYLLLSLRSIDVRGWYFIMPLLVAIVGGVVLFMPSVRSNVNEVVLVTGISLLLFNITSLQEYFAERRTIKAQLAALKAQQDAAATAVVTDEPEKPAAATEEDTEA